MKDYY